jgi:hypothetical protein
MADALPETPQALVVPARKRWTLPTLAELPKLTALTLVSAIGGGGGTSGGGSTVFGLLLAAGLVLLSACSPDQSMEPSAPAMPKPVATISCSGNIATLKLRCGSVHAAGSGLQAAGGGPQAAPGVEILGGQGIEVALRSFSPRINGFGEFEVAVSLQNLSTQRIGWTGTTPTGEEVFFINGPVADVGTISVAHGSHGDFTGTNQDYYQYIGMLEPMQTSDTVLWTFLLNGGVNTFTFTVMVAADVFDQGGPLQWRPIDGTTQRWYNDVVASSATDRMAVGNNGLTAHYTGGKWVALPPIVSENINAVFAVAPGEYLAATGGGAVLYFRNRVWTEIYRRGDFGILQAIWAKDTSLIVAVGQQGRISRYVSGTWTDEDVPTAGSTSGSGDFMAVSGSTDDSLISAVSNAFPLDNGQVWFSVAGSGFGLDPNFAPIAGIASDIVYDASGNSLLAYIDITGPTGVIVSSTGATLYSGPLWPRQLLPHGTDKVAFGFLDTDLGGNAVSELDYSSLPAIPTPLAGAVPSPFDIVQLTATNSGLSQFAITSNNGHLLSYNGTTWTDDQGFGDWTDPDLWGIGDSIYALDGIGGFHKIVDGVVTTLPSAGGVSRLWGISSTEFWAINATEAWHFDPVNGWTNEHTVPGGSDNRDVWADPTGDAGIVLGENGWVSSRILGVWSDYQVPGRNVTAVWGCDSHQAWITTFEGQVYKWVDGAVTLDSTLGPNHLRAINGNQFCDPWVAGDNGTMWHRFGGVWINRFDPSASSWNLKAVAIRGANQTIATGDDGNYGLFSDASQLQSTPLPTQGEGIKALWRLSNGEVYAAGNNVLLRGYR